MNTDPVIQTGPGGDYTRRYVEGETPGSLVEQSGAPAQIERLTSSRCGLFLACSESARAADVVYEDSSEGSELGKAVHTRLAEIIRGGDTTPYPPHIDADEAGILVGCAMKLYNRDLKKYVSSPRTEIAFEPSVGPDRKASPWPKLHGRADVAHVGIDTFAALDWKTDRTDPDERYIAQLRHVCLCAALCFPDIERFSGSVVWARHDQVDTRHWSRADLMDLYREIQERAQHPRYSPGGHCTYCPRRLRCEARRTWLRDACSFVSDLTLADPPGELLATTLDKIRAIEDACDVARKAIKAHVLNVGKIPTRDGKCLKIITQERRSLLTGKALPVLAQVLDKTELARCVSIQLSKAEQIVREKYDRGEKKEAVEALTAKLNEAGAITISPSDTLREVKDEDAKTD